MTQRRRIALAIAGAVALLAVVLVVLLRGDGEGGPPDTLAGLVPSGALVYAHLSTDRGRAEDRRFARLAGALPPVARLRDSLAGAVAPGAFTLERDVRPWLGDEAAYAALSPADTLLLAAVADRAGAEALVARIGNLDAAASYRGVRVLSAGPTALAFVREDVLAVGTEAAVRAAVDRAQGAGDALPEAPAYERATAERPAGRTLDVYASARGVREVLAPRGGLLGAVGTLVDRPGLEAAGAAFAAEPAGLRVEARLAGGAPEGAAFTPVLVERVPEAAVAYLGLRSASRLMRLLGRLGGAAAVERARTLVADGAGVDLDRELLAPLSGELALAVTTGAEDPGGSSGGAPVVTLKARTADPERTDAALARLHDPLATLLAQPGSVPAFRPLTVGALRGFSLRATPELAPSYAVSPDGVVLSTAPAGLLPPVGTIAAAPAFRATIGDVPDQADSLLFLDLRQLLALGEQTGLTAIPGLGTARDDLARVRAAGLTVVQDPARKTDTTAELFLEIP
ncbi:MAG TPA: DUF3352 domain-containing protein [Solirubrobacteraceae bacterium]|nr:DUF3352 domain-containing protein [Solirubrobacteraceae bacterium]